MSHRGGPEGGEPCQTSDPHAFRRIIKGLVIRGGAPWRSGPRRGRVDVPPRSWFCQPSESHLQPSSRRRAAAAAAISSRPRPVPRKSTVPQHTPNWSRTARLHNAITPLTCFPSYFPPISIPDSSQTKIDRLKSRSDSLFLAPETLSFNI